MTHLFSKVTQLHPKKEQAAVAYYSIVSMFFKLISLVMGLAT
jgi:hypothetical protein